MHHKQTIGKVMEREANQIVQSLQTLRGSISGANAMVSPLKTAASIQQGMINEAH